jgi:hypothetical protein
MRNEKRGVIMKKYAVLLLGMMILQNAQAMAIRTWNAQRMSFAGHQAFGKDWLFKQAIDIDGLRTWESECATGLNEAKSNIDTLNKKKREVISGYISQVSRANDDLINNIKITYNSMFSPAARNLVASAQARLNKKMALRPLFDKIVKEMSDLKLQIMVARKKTKSSHELAAYDILDDLAQQIMNVARTAAKSVDFLQ